MQENRILGAVIPTHIGADWTDTEITALLELQTLEQHRVVGDRIVCNNASTDATCTQSRCSLSRRGNAGFYPEDVSGFFDGDQAPAHPAISRPADGGRVAPVSKERVCIDEEKQP